MNAIKSSWCSALLACAVFVAPASFAGSEPVVYVSAHQSHFSATVYENGTPVEGAVVKVSSALEPARKAVTNKYGRANFHAVIDAGTFTAIAETSGGVSEPRMFRLER